MTVGYAQPLEGGSELEIIQIRPNVYVIFGAGGNITMHVGEDAAILVDSGTADMADEVLETLRNISDRNHRAIFPDDHRRDLAKNSVGSGSVTFDGRIGTKDHSTQG